LRDFHAFAKVFELLKFDKKNITLSSDQLKFWSKIEIWAKHWKFGQRLKFWSKRKIWSKHLILVKNWPNCSKIAILAKNWKLVKN